MTEYSPWPGTARSNTREETEEPCTKKITGRDGSPGFGAPSRLRYIHNGTSHFLAQYSLLQMSAPSTVTAAAACAGNALERPAATTPSPALLMTPRRGSGLSRRFMV